MHWLEALLLGIVQGLTEFIPVSSSGHLVLLHDAFGIEANGLTFDVALHVGTLIALIAYFRKDISTLAKGMVRRNADGRLAWLVAVATIPAVLFGVIMQDAAESSFRSAVLVSINLIGVAFLMLLAERYAARRKHRTELRNATLNQAIVVGVAQAAAIIPGISRSGSTITAGIFAGFDRVSATRFSFLMGIPVTAGAILKVLVTDQAASQIADNGGVFLIGIIAAFASGVLAIRFLLSYLAKHTLALFAYYRIGLGAAVLLITLLA